MSENLFCGWIRSLPNAIMAVTGIDISTAPAVKKATSTKYLICFNEVSCRDMPGRL